MAFFKEYEYLLMRRESRVVIGKGAVNLWLLVLVLTATFFSISFSEGCLHFLEDRMNDPFTNWVNIYRNSSGARIGAFRDSLYEDSTRQKTFLFDFPQTEIATSINLIKKNGGIQMFDILFYEHFNNDLIKAVLSPNNIRNNAGIDSTDVPDATIGIVITDKTLTKLGYDIKHIPPYVYMSRPYENGDTLGYELVNGEYVRIPLPILAVVHHLPMNMEAIGSYQLFQYIKDDSDDGPFNMDNREYAENLLFFVPKEITDFSNVVISVVPDSVRRSDAAKEVSQRIQENLHTWMDGSIFQISFKSSSADIENIKQITQGVQKHYDNPNICRVYDYGISNKAINPDQESVLSIHFNSLERIRAFSEYVKGHSGGLQVEMEQVNSKENFNTVSILAKTLTVAMIVFAIVCIIFFIMNMLQSHFLKVKRNLGTFKAFGISTNELSKVYVAIIVFIVSTALLIALVITGSFEAILSFANITKDEEHGYLELLNIKTLIAALIILLSSVITVLFVMRRMLRHTPGDLIYDR